MIDFASAFAAGLEHHRKESGMSVREIALRIRYNPAYVERLLTGKARLSITSMSAIALAMGRMLELKLVDVSENQKQIQIEFREVKLNL